MVWENSFAQEFVATEAIVNVAPRRVGAIAPFFRDPTEILFRWLGPGHIYFAPYT